MVGWIEDGRFSEDSTAKYGIFVEDRRLSEDSTAKYGWLDREPKRKVHQEGGGGSAQGLLRTKYH